MYNPLISEVKSVFVMLLPLVNIKVSPHKLKNWFTNGFKISRNSFKELRKESFATNSAEMKSRYKQF